MTFGERLRFHRERLGLSQARLAHLLDISAPCVSLWEHGREPALVTQIGVMEVLESTPTPEPEPDLEGAV